MTRPRGPRPCLLHADYHVLADNCLGAVVEFTRRHPKPFTHAAHDDYQRAVEQAILDRLIRRHLSYPEASMPAYHPEGDPAPVPQDDDLEQAA